MPEHEVVAWHRHITAGRVQSCATLDDSDGQSRLWLIVAREIDGQWRLFAEMMEPLFQGEKNVWTGQIASAPVHVDGLNGLHFMARAIPCLPEVGMENGTTALRVKKINAVKVRVINSKPFKCRIISQNAEDTELMDVPAKSLSSNDRLSRRPWADEAEWHCPTGAGFRDGARLEFVCDGPEPVTILAATTIMDVSREAGGQI